MKVFKDALFVVIMLVTASSTSLVNHENSGYLMNRLAESQGNKAIAEGHGTMKKMIEGHAIVKRMAEGHQHFEGHDVARVHLVDGLGQRGRRMVKRDLRETLDNVNGGKTMKTLQIALSSGSNLNLTIQPSRILSADTLVVFHTANGRMVTRKKPRSDCYFHGRLEDTRSKGWAAVSICDGVFGFAASHHYEYFFQPIGTNHLTMADTAHGFDVNVMWRRSKMASSNLGRDAEDVAISASDGKRKRHNSDQDTMRDAFRIPDEEVNALDYLRNLETSLRKRARSDGIEDEDISYFHPDGVNPRRQRRAVVEKRNATTKGIVIEVAMFSDAHYWQLLQQRYPGREDDFLLTRLAATQALFSNGKRLGYDIQIKVKVLEYWMSDPQGYVYDPHKLSHNLKSFCEYTTDKYFYDLHIVNTGIVDHVNGNIGLAYIRGMCSKKRCVASRAINLNQFVVYAHEIGHTMGMTHLSSVKCPEEMKDEGGFMGGDVPYNFSPCMKYQLEAFLNMSKSQCLFEETGQTKTAEAFNDLPSALPGQLRTTDDLCRILAGPGFNYVPLGKSPGKPVCQWMVCLNEDRDSLEFGRARHFPSPNGFPCDEESFCVSQVCRRWNETGMPLEVGSMRTMRTHHQWSSWSDQVSDCSRSCGTGVRSRRRVCQISGLNLSPYCPGPSVKVELCNQEPCPQDPTDTPTALRQARGDEVCSRFKRNNVGLNLKEADDYLPTSTGAVLTSREAGANVRKARSVSCLLKCDRDPKDAEGDLDAFMPDGTPCLRVDSTRPASDLRRFNIDLRCVRGVCLEFTDCPEASQSKDKCGVCGGDGGTC